MTSRAALIELAELYGVFPSYTSSAGDQIEVSEDTLVRILRALGVDFGELVDDSLTDASLQAAVEGFHDADYTRLLPACVVALEGDAHVFPVHVHDGAPAKVWIELEDGTTRETNQTENWNPPRTVDGVTWGEASFSTPTDLPLGWHTLHLESGDLRASCGLVITPSRLSTTDKYVASPRTGVMAQIYSVRSENSWGMGDFHDLGHLAEMTATKSGADFLLINPVHAAEPFPPVEASPYLPTTRRFINPIYIRVEDVPEFDLLDAELQSDVAELAAEFRELNHDASEIDRDPIYAAKLQVLREIFNLGRSEAREQSFREFIGREGTGLVDFATWCAKREADHALGAHAADNDLAELTDFHMWLQWICDEQLGAAQERATKAGMSIGVMADLAVGVHPGGADAHNLASVLAPEASVGAPPDPYNQHGQDWSQPPWHPVRLAEAGYRPWRDLLRTVLRHSGGIRVDHILGLFRLFWIPRMQHPSTGTYVRYDYNALVGILALEAERAGAVVIGEDLGTFEPWVQDVLAARGVMGTSILWFEQSPSTTGPRHQHEYRELALSSVTTHDLPPTAGYLNGEHITLRERLGVLTTDPAEEDIHDLVWQNEILDRAAASGAFEGTEAADRSFNGLARSDRGTVTDLMKGLHNFIAGTPSALTCVSLVDMVGDRRAQNQPGTTNDLYPNWCVPLTDNDGTAITIEDLPDNAMFRAVSEASQRPDSSQ